jgi:selenocysteine lyase/cysteine desulfurase
MSMDRLQFLRRLGLGAGVLALNPLRAETTRSPADWPPPATTGTPEFWEAVRSQYVIDEDLVYLNCGGLGPSPRPVLDMLDLTSRILQHRVETGHFYFEDARSLMAEFLGAQPDELCFTRNATEGNSIVAAGLGLHAGDEVIFETHAHPGGSLPWLNRARQSGIVVRTFEPDASSPEGNLERIAALVTPRTRVVQVSHVTAPTGIVMPVQRLAEFTRAKGLWLHVDGAQSAGMIPFRLHALGCDSFATSGHKWLGAPRETGVLFIRRERVEEVAPLHVGAYSSGDFDLCGQLVYTQGARRHEYGTRNAASVVALAAAARFQNTIGRERIAEHGRALAERLVAALQAVPRVQLLTPTRADLRAAMVTFAVEGRSANAVFSHLMETQRLRCRPVTEAGLEAVRVSLHVFNTPEHCDRIVDAMVRFTRV